MVGEWPFNDPDRANVASVRAGLRNHDAVRMLCFNRDEALYIYRALTTAERARVALTWTFGGSEHLA